MGLIDQWPIILMILYILTLHWVADFVCQSRYMAANKSKCNWTLLWHVGIYTCVMTLGLAGFAYITKEYWATFFFLAINGILHYITDYYSSRQTTKRWKTGKVHGFFVVIGADQLIHQICLIGTLALII